MGAAVYNMNFFILSFVIYCVVATPISTINKNNRVVGGFDAHAGQFPYQAAIRFLDEPTILCGGSIISNQWILTSGVCLTVTTSDKMRVVVGSIYLNSGGTTHTVLISLTHPNFNINRYTNDIGLIRVNGQISYNDFVQPIELASDAISVGLSLTISGWGGTNSWEEMTNTLQYAILKSISPNECKKGFPITLPLYDTQLCTETSNRQGLCTGDYGSPLVYNGKQHAISSIPFYCTYSVPDIHTRVAPFRSWIKEITNV